MSRDRLKEGALQTLGPELAADPELALRICEVFFTEIELLARSGVSLVAEAAFQHKVWAPRLAPSMEIADVRVIVCELPIEVAKARCQERELTDPLWTSYHPTPGGEPWAQPYDPPRLEVPTHRLDASEPISTSIRALLGFLN